MRSGGVKKTDTTRPAPYGIFKFTPLFGSGEIKLQTTAKSVTGFQSRADGGVYGRFGLMIPQFSDHAANERTYLAWVRTGISIIAFGFVLERFSLFLHTVSESFGDKSPVEISRGGREAGLAMVLAGLLALVVATWRFAATQRKLIA